MALNWQVKSGWVAAMALNWQVYLWLGCRNGLDA